MKKLLITLSVFIVVLLAIACKPGEDAANSETISAEDILTEKPNEKGALAGQASGYQTPKKIPKDLQVSKEEVLNPGPLSTIVDDCGNGIKNSKEVCDGIDLAGQSCTSQGKSAGILSCNPGCTSFNYDLCVGCTDTDKNTTLNVNDNGLPASTYAYINFEKRGLASGVYKSSKGFFVGSLTDQCIRQQTDNSQTTILRESYCEYSTGLVLSLDHVCVNKICKDGACVGK